MRGLETEIPLEAGLLEFAATAESLCLRPKAEAKLLRAKGWRLVGVACSMALAVEPCAAAKADWLPSRSPMGKWLQGQ